MKISIITVCYNSAATIRDTIESVLAQTHPDIEYIIVDGASTDVTLTIIHDYDTRIAKIISEPDQGLYDAINKGIKVSTGEIIGLMHSDDVYSNKNILSIVAAEFNVDSIEAVYGDLTYITKAPPPRTIRYWKSGQFSLNKLKHGWMPPHPTLYLRRHVFQKNGYYDTNYRISADYDAILRWFGGAQIRSSYIPEVLVKMRVGGESNRSLKKILQKTREDYLAIKSNQIGGLATLFFKNIRKLHQFFNTTPHD